MSLLFFKPSEEVTMSFCDGENISSVGVPTRTGKNRLAEKVIEISILFDVTSNIDPSVENKVKNVSNEDWSPGKLITVEHRKKMRR